MMPMLMVILNLATVAIMWFGGNLVADGEMPIGDLTAFLTYIMQILFAVLMATMMFVMVPRAAASAERIQEVLETQPTIVDPDEPAGDVAVHGLVEFRDVEFRYPGAEEPVLSGITFSARPGETTAIVGSTGSGKSTLISLIPRFYDVTGGAVLVDGVDVRELAQQDLWRRIGLVPQKAFLFSGTVADNLRHGDEQAADERLWHALEIAQGREFVGEPCRSSWRSTSPRAAPTSPAASASAWPSPGRSPSRPRSTIFDDSFSALDFTTDAQLRAALAQAHGRRHRDHRRAARGHHHARRPIVVLEDGTVAGIGTHQELLKTCETYREIVASQLGEEEVA